MSRPSGGQRTGAALEGELIAPAGDGGRRFLRDSHIYASAVREVLESKLLQDVTSLPLTFSQLRILRCMAGNGSHQVGEVAGWLGVSPPAATRNVDKLVRLGLLVRRRSRGDRRAALIALSPRSRTLMSRYERHTAECLDPLLREFPREEVARFTRSLERFTLSLLRHGQVVQAACLRCAAYFQNSCPVAGAIGGCPSGGTRSAQARREPPPARRRSPDTRSKA
jgi:DNA-binding MarR family transcriptional regulator